MAEHVDHLAAQLTEIVADGTASGEFVAADHAAAGRALLYATAKFHHPLHAAEWADPAIHADFTEAWKLLVHGLAVRC